MTPSNRTPTEPLDDPMGQQLRRELPDDDDNIDAALQLAELRRRFTGATLDAVPFRRWAVERRLGKGAMGAVYLARDGELDRRVALKVLGPFAGSEHTDMSQRMRREAQALARIDHPNVVTVHGVDLEGGRPVIEMEYVDGTTLRTWQAQASGWREVLEVYIEVGEGLAAIHAAALVHRDIKPDNLLRGSDGRVKIVDLGLAIGPRPVPPDPAPRADASLLSAHITAAGGVAGTPAYMAPECFEPAAFTPAADQFAFAVSLYEALQGVLPFEVTPDLDRYAQAVRKGQLREPEPALRRPGWLTRALRQALRYDPDQRHPSMDTLVHALRAGLRRRRRWWWGSAIVVTSSTLTGLGWVLAAPGPDPCATLAQSLEAEVDPLGPLRARIVGDAQPHVQRAAELLDQTYAARRAGWQQARLAQCEARSRRPDPPPELELRAACLDRTRAQLDALAAGPAPEEPELAGWLVATTKQLERMPHCDEPLEQLAGWTSGSTATRQQLVRASALERAGDYVQAEAEAEAAIAATEGTQPRLHAQALYRLGHILGSHERGQESFAALTKARNAAFQVGHEGLLCEVVAYRAKLSAVIAVDPAISADDVGLAQACLERTHPRSILLRADMLEARGLLAQAAGEPEAAIDWHGQALELRQTHLGRRGYEVSKSLQNLANALEMAGRARQAEAPMLEALRLREAVFGPRHPKVADVLNDLGTLLYALDELGPARERLERARRIYADAYGPSAPHNARVHLSLGLVALGEQNLPAAQEHLARARALQEVDGNLGPDHPDRADLLQGEGIVHVLRKDFAAALRLFEQGTEILRRHDPRAPAVLDSTLREIDMLYGLHDHAEVTRRAGQEPRLRAHVVAMEASERGRLSWYIGDSSLTEHHAEQAVAYLRIAKDAYTELQDADSTAELSSLLSRAIEQSTH